MRVSAKGGKVLITVECKEIDPASGYPYTSSRTISLTPYECRTLVRKLPELSEIAESAERNKRRRRIKGLEDELRVLRASETTDT